MRVKVLPKGYDPVVAAGPPTEDYVKMGLNWTPEDTQRMRETEKNAPIMDVEDTKDQRLVGLWCQEA